MSAEALADYSLAKVAFNQADANLPVGKQLLIILLYALGKS